MPNIQSSSWLRYFVVVLSVALALFVTLQSELLTQRTPFALFFAAVMISTWYGGLNPGLLATALSALVTNYFIIPPVYSLRLDTINLLEEAVFISVAVFITALTSAHQRNEKAMRESEERYRLLFGNNPHPMWVYDLETLRFLTVNKAAIQHYGYTNEEFLSLKITDIRPQEDIPGLLENISRVNGNLDVAGVWRHYKKDGSQIDVEVVSHGLIMDGRPAELVMITDITERRRAERERERFFSLSADLLVIAGFDGYFKWVSPTWERTFGWTSEELTSNPWLYFVHPDDQESTIAEAEKLFRGEETILFENRYRHKDGTYRWISWKVRPYIQEQRLYCAGVDISEHKLLGDQLRQAQKLESIGQLAGGVAHDFNNLLTVIRGYADLCLQLVPQESRIRRHLAEITQAAERATSLTRQLLAFSRKQVLQPKILDLTDAISNMDRMLRRLIGEHILLVTMLDPKLGKVKADPSQIEQVLMNLAINARDAMPAGGKLTIETKNVFLDESYARLHVSVTTGPYVMLAVSDTGHGMDAQTVARIFEPFFTTKETGKGTGLGLAMVYGIVKQSGGNIWVYSEPQHGTTFKIYLPLAEGDEESSHEEETVVHEVAKATETVLLVEDEGSVRALLLNVLQSEGYRVLAASSGPEALAICEKHEGPIHLLMTDVVMPEMSGRELVERLAGKCECQKVLYMSGYTDEAIVHHGVLNPGVNFLQKPFTPSAVARKVREVLNP